MNRLLIAIQRSQLYKNVPKQTKTQHPTRPYLVGQLLVVVLLWSTCWLLTGCGIRSSSLTLQPATTRIQAYGNTVRYDLTVEYDDEIFEDFFTQRGATAIWQKLFAVNYTQVVDASILHSDPAIVEILSLYAPNVQDELKVGMTTYIERRNREIPFRDFLFAHRLKEVWDTLNQAKAQDTLALNGMLKGLATVVQKEVLEGVFQFIRKHIPNLVELGLSYNELTTLPDSFGHLTQLQTLDLAANHLKAFPNFILNLLNLNHLRLNNNQLKALPDTFGNLNKLQVLYLSENQLERLPDTFGNLNKLQVLYLDKNQLRELPATFGDLRQLQMLHLNNNQLKALPDTFGNLNKLQVLYLSENQLERLPDTFGNLNKLEILILSSNKLTTLPDSLKNLKNLQILNLRNTQLSTLPDSLKNLISSLHELDISENQLKELPEFLYNLPNLRLFIFRENNPMTCDKIQY